MNNENMDAAANPNTEPLVDDSPRIDLSAESFDTDAATLSMGDDVDAVIAEDDAAEMLDDA